MMMSVFVQVMQAACPADELTLPTGQFVHDVAVVTLDLPAGHTLHGE